MQDHRPFDPGPRKLRALAHPLRVRMIGLLRTEGPATATTLAKRLGESTGATSYHLRQLAAYGLIEEDPERHGHGRERWWRSASASPRFGVSTLEVVLHAEPAGEYRLDLTPDRLKALTEEIETVVERYRDEPGVTSDDTREVIVGVQAFPRHTPAGS